MKFSPFSAFFISIALALLVIFIIDPLDPTTFSTPFCLGMILMWLSLRQKAWVVLCIAVLYCCLDFYATDAFLGSFRLPAQHPYFWFFQRFGLFFVVCVMAVYMSYLREESERNLNHIQSVLRKLPAPMVISDAAGYITFVNEALCNFFEQPSAKLVGNRYVDLFMGHTQEGKAMRYYIELFAEQSNTAHEVELRVPVSPVNTKGYLICMGQGANRSMITVLQVSEGLVAK